MCSALTSKWVRSASRVSERPNPSVPSTVYGRSTQRRDHVRQRLHVVGGGHDRSRRRVEALADVGDARLGVGVEAVPALDLERVVAQLLERGRAPHVGGDVVALGEQLLGLERLEQDRARGEDLDAAAALRRRSEPVEAAQHALVDAVRLRRLRPVLVVERDVVEDVLAALAVHAVDALADDDRELVGEGRVVGHEVRHRRWRGCGTARRRAGGPRRSAWCGRRWRPS